tara:strand:+ start:1592 stop:2332 length:741 start_codon:yes stop_codon:yes gene_type:complete
MAQKINKNLKPDFSLILPCYNESSHIYKSLYKIINSLNNNKFTYEIIIIDDKSKDNTVKHIKNLVKKYKNLICYFHDKNIGRGGTVAEGILKAKADIVGFIDIDLEVTPDYIPTFVRILKNNEADIVIADRYYPFYFFPLSSMLRVISSKGYIYFVKLLLNLPVRDTEAGYKFFNKEKILPILPKVKNKHWFWDTEILARSLKEKLRIKEIPVVFLRNKYKKSTVKLIPDTIGYLKAIHEYKRSNK